MKQDKMLAQMKAITHAIYLREHAKVKPILDREAHLRGKVTMLKEQVAEAKKAAEGSHEIKALGVDLEWQKWHMQTRRHLNQELAQITAQKLKAMSKLRNAFGRKHAVETMAVQEATDRKERKNKQLFDRLMNLE